MQKKNDGITMIALVATIIILIILTSFTIRIIVNESIFKKAEDYTVEEQKQIDEHQETSNMVRNLYKNEN